MQPEFVLDELVERLIIIEKKAEAEKSIQDGRVFTNEQVKTEIERWKKEARERHSRSKMLRDRVVPEKTMRCIANLMRDRLG